MIKKLCTLLLLTCITAAPSLAQRYSSSDDASFAPKKGQWQVSVLLGSGKFFNENTSYLLPKFSNDGGVVGLPNGGTDNSGDLNRYLNIGSLNNNSLVNIAGIEGKYFVSDNWDVNFQFSMNVSLTPKKDYVEGDNSVPDMIIPAQSYINAQMTNNWYVSVGSNYYFKTRNERIHPYLGGALGFQMARIETTEPYTGVVTGVIFIKSFRANLYQVITVSQRVHFETENKTFGNAILDTCYGSYFETVHLAGFTSRNIDL